MSCTLQEGAVPEALLVGKMTLIDKKVPSLKVNQKVMLKKFEAKGYYRNIQNVFRTGRSASDCLFMLLATIHATRNRHAVSIAFCDIAKAYDFVNSLLLYTKLDSIGFGGRVKSLIQSMYNNNCVRVCRAGGLSSPLWFSKVVKQGCVLSHLLFALYIS